MKGVLIAICEQIGILYYQAPPEAHNSISCERFHRYLNKGEKIGAADAEPYEKWAINALFAAHAWNGSRVNGTDIISVTRREGKKVSFSIRYPDRRRSGKDIGTRRSGHPTCRNNVPALVQIERRATKRIDKRSERAP